jgi:hypothetical protein
MDWSTTPVLGQIDWDLFNLEALPAGKLIERLEQFPLFSRFAGFASRMALPARLRQEVHQIADRMGLSYTLAAAVQLDYELGGGCCTTAAVADEDYGSYRMVRACDWTIPAGFARRIKWTPIADHVWVRAVPAYIGCVCGHSVRGGFALALNQSEHVYEKIDLDGGPLTWLLRAVLKAPDFDTAVDRALHIQPIVGGYVTIVGKDRAVWLELDPGGHTIHREVEYPEPLVVCNEDGGPEYGEDDELLRWSETGKFRTGDIGFPVRNDETADLVQFVV